MKNISSMIRKFCAAAALLILLISVPGFTAAASTRGLQVPPDDSTLTDQSGNPTVDKGQHFQIFFTFTNSGSNTWLPDTYWLQNQEGAMGADPKQPLSSVVVPGGISVWTINLTAPSTPGVYRTSWMVSHNDVDFGAYAWVDVTVKDSNSSISIGGITMGTYMVKPNLPLRISYAGTNNGPVVIKSTVGAPIIASERVAYTPDGGVTWPNFSELMGLPSNQLTTSYVLPWYNNVELNSQLRFGNLGTANTIVTVRVGGVTQGTYFLAPSQSKRVSYAGLNNGPVVISSSGGVPIIASERVSYTPDGGVTWTSFSEVMGLPTNKLTTSYTLPWYNNVELNSQIRFGNVGTVNTVVTVTVAGVVRGTYLLAPSKALRVAYPGLNNGPIKVTSSGGVPIIASERVAYFDGSNWTSFSEVMGLPSSALTTTYWLPYYNNAELNTQVRFGNVGTVPTNVTVTIGGVVRGVYFLNPSRAVRVSYAGLNSGPIKITSSGGVPIIASERVAYFDGSNWTSFSEMMGLPANQLATSYVMPWYNNVELNTQLRFAAP